MKTEYLTSEAERKYRKAYYERNRESILRKSREKYAQNPDKYRERSRQYSMTHDRSGYYRQYHRKKKEGAVC